MDSLSEFVIDRTALLDHNRAALPLTLNQRSYTQSGTEEINDVNVFGVIASDNSLSNQFNPIVHDHFAPLSKIDVDIHAYLGYPVTIEYELTATVGAEFSTNDIITYTGGSALAGADIAHTMTWGGITSVTDSNGVPIVGWSVTSGSGFDYSQPFPTPEPSTLVLLMFAAAGWCLRRCLAA